MGLPLLTKSIQREREKENTMGTRIARKKEAL
jgi:hypothetical protein